MTTPTRKRAGRPRVTDGMITRPIAMTPEQWAFVERIGGTYASGTRIVVMQAMAAEQERAQDGN